jgi:hypothetical protein
MNVLCAPAKFHKDKPLSGAVCDCHKEPVVMDESVQKLFNEGKIKEIKCGLFVLDDMLKTGKITEKQKEAVISNWKNR